MPVAREAAGCDSDLRGLGADVGWLVHRVRLTPVVEATVELLVCEAVLHVDAGGGALPPPPAMWSLAVARGS